MSIKKSKNTVESVENLVKPIIEEMGLELWDVRFVKEGALWYLRIFIDKESGVTIEDCEAVTHAVDKPLDDLDPIEVPYTLEISSPGIERELVRESHFEKFLGAAVMVKLIRPNEEKEREFKGTLTSADRDTAEIVREDGRRTVINKKDAVYIKLDDFNI